MKIFIGWNKKYADNYDKIFRKTLREKIIIFFDNLLYDLFLKGEKND